MEIALLILLLIPYMAIHYWLTDHDTPADKDRKRFQRGLTLLRDREYEEAFTFFNETVRLYPKSAIAYALRAKCQLALGNQYSAIYDLTQAISRDNTLADCYLDKGQAHYQLTEYVDAFREFDKAVWYFRDEQPDAYRWRALCRLELGQVKQAEGDLRRAVLLGDENSFHLLKQPPFTQPTWVRSER
jgi:tetratricopeptide (TPR) repeat protein